jgi:DNA-binding GntR family transcriptional regulator
MTQPSIRRATGNAGQASESPLYHQVATALREEIVSGVFPVGSRLPTEDKLCQRFSVSRYTVREALRLLREDGLVASRRGAGTAVIPPGQSGSDIHQVMSINDLVTFGTDARFVIEAVGMTAMDRKLAARTGLAAGEQWLEVIGFRHVDGSAAPLCRTEYYINRAFAAVGRILQHHTGPIFPLLEDMFGQTIAEVQQQIAATLIQPRLAVRLGVPEESAALEVRRTYTTADGTIAQVTINTHPADRFQHSMTMRRVRM